jgi:PncC family amidohydrolase
MTKEQDVAVEVANRLRDRGWTISVGELDTGGLLGSRLIAVPGATRFFRGGLCCYENRALLVNVAKVPAALVEEKGAGSPETALALAQGVRALTDTDIALAESGWAGPTGGRHGQPAGLVYIALASRDGQTVLIEENWHSTDRYGNMQRTVERALRLALDFLAGRIQGSASEHI